MKSPGCITSIPQEHMLPLHTYGASMECLENDSQPHDGSAHKIQRPSLPDAGDRPKPDRVSLGTPCFGFAFPSPSSVFTHASLEFNLLHPGTSCVMHVSRICTCMVYFIQEVDHRQSALSGHSHRRMNNALRNTYFVRSFRSINFTPCRRGKGTEEIHNIYSALRIIWIL